MPAFFIITIDACFCSSEKMDHNFSVQSAATLGISINRIIIHTVYSRCPWITLPDAKFLDEIQAKVFLLAFHSHLYSFCQEISISSNSRNLLQFLEFSYCTPVRRKVENLSENHTLSYGVRNPYRHIKSENSQEIRSWIRLLYGVHWPFRRKFNILKSNICYFFYLDIN